MSNHDFLTKTLTDTLLTRRGFLKWSTALGGTVALAGGVQTGLKALEKAAAAPEGKWISAACWHNCSDENCRCLLKAYVVDGVPVRVKSDDDYEIKDTIDIPQRRACVRGRAQRKQVLAGDRLKYPMKRKNWEPGTGGKRELRGRDEWVRISWDEALDLAATEIKRIYDTYGPRSVFGGGWGYDPINNIMKNMGGFVSVFGTVSWGSWQVDEAFLEGTWSDSNDRMSLRDAKLIVLDGCNWAATKAGNIPHFLQLAKDNGAKVIIIDPLLNQTVEGIADQWIPIIPGTDATMFLAIAHYMITNNLQDQAFLDKYCIGFDADHMPEGADPKENFKDYVLGTYDGVPKTPEWAEPKCGVPADVIRDLAVQMATVKPMSMWAGNSTTKFPAGDMWAQIYYTVGWMTGNVGRSGACISHHGPDPIYGTGTLIRAGYSGAAYIPNPIFPKILQTPAQMSYFTGPDVTDESDWVALDFATVWQNILDGEFGTDKWPGGKRKVDIKAVIHAGQNFLNSIPNTNAGIKVHRQVEFVMACTTYYQTNARYADLVFPITTRWERQGSFYHCNREHINYFQKVMEPLFEARDDWDVAVGIAERLGMDVATVLGPSQEQQEYNAVAGTMVMKPDGSGFEPLVTITADDIKAFGVVGEPQVGRITWAEFREAGIYRVPRKYGDKLTYIKQKAFVDDPVANPLTTKSGKLEIYCKDLADVVNNFGYTEISPIGKWQESTTHGNTARTKEYPLILYTPHSLRRAHTALDNVGWLREAFPQECFMSPVDAEERGIQTGDVVLMTSPHGKVLRRAKVLPGMEPGTVALEDGSWVLIDEETGIDLGGNPNILQAPQNSGRSFISWTGTLLQVEKYTGPLKLLPDSQWPDRVPNFVKG